MRTVIRLAALLLRHTAFGDITVPGQKKISNFQSDSGRFIGNGNNGDNLRRLHEL